MALGNPNDACCRCHKQHFGKSGSTKRQNTEAAGGEVAPLTVLRASTDDESAAFVSTSRRGCERCDDEQRRPRAKCQLSARRLAFHQRWNIWKLQSGAASPGCPRFTSSFPCTSSRLASFRIRTPQLEPPSRARPAGASSRSPYCAEAASCDDLSSTRSRSPAAVNLYTCRPAHHFLSEDDMVP